MLAMLPLSPPWQYKLATTEASQPPLQGGGGFIGGASIFPYRCCLLLLRWYYSTVYWYSYSTVHTSKVQYNCMVKQFFKYLYLYPYHQLVPQKSRTRRS